MSIDIKVPAMGESVTEATVARWFKKEGDSVARDEPLVELETDKVTVEVPSPAAGHAGIDFGPARRDGQVGTVLGAIADGAGASRPVPAKPAPQPAAPKPAPAQQQPAPAATRPGGRAGATCARHARDAAHLGGNRESIRQVSTAPARAAA